MGWGALGRGCGELHLPTLCPSEHRGIRSLGLWIPPTRPCNATLGQGAEAHLDTESGPLLPWLGAAPGPGDALAGSLSRYSGSGAFLTDIANSVEPQVGLHRQEQHDILSSASDSPTPQRPPSTASSYVLPEEEDKDLHRAMAYSLSELEDMGQHRVDARGSKKRRVSTRRARKGASEEAGAALAPQSRATGAESPGGGDSAKEGEERAAELQKVGSIPGATGGGLVPDESESVPDKSRFTLSDLKSALAEIESAPDEMESVVCVLL